ncbi:MAG: hypothetical protein SF028_10495 [Candidatus Sumerlaeia bacterium]|nr:hypothetical protein [Candidatus Sumerlaeia bacterium]
MRARRSTTALAAALALGAALSLSGQDGARDDRVRIEDLRITNTRGTVRMQDMKAESLEVGTDARIAEAREVEALVASRDDSAAGPMRCTAPEATIFLQAGAEAPPPTPKGAPDPAPSQADAAMLDSVERMPAARRSAGDFVLRADGVRRVELEAEGRGRVVAERLFWSEEHRHLVGAGAFEQRISTPEGGLITVTGDSFAIDAKLSSWSYHTKGGTPITLTVTPPGTEGTAP